MALVIEDGTGKSNADSFVSEDDMDTYATDNDLTSWLDGSGDAEAALRRATAYLSNSYSWKGYKVNGRSQSLAWPRSEVYDAEDNAVAADAVPYEIITATCELAAYERNSPGALTPAIISAEQIKREVIRGVIEVEYNTSAFATPEGMRPVLLFVNDIVAGLTVAGRGASGLSGIAVRV